jgi:hypothetical protein
MLNRLFKRHLARKKGLQALNANVLETALGMPILWSINILFVPWRGLAAFHALPFAHRLVRCCTFGIQMRRLKGRAQAIAAVRRRRSQW